ncbi:MAG TPA: hypothetical protein VG265_16545 [Gaiellaceae bacterium]|jgi:hypothetical protein|nr:hypothetical protein [Gaiellaceae bacterium]
MIEPLAFGSVVETPRGRGRVVRITNSTRRLCAGRVVYDEATVAVKLDVGGRSVVFVISQIRQP